MRNREYSAPVQIAIGFCVIGLGVLFLLDNLGWLDIRYTIHFWPMAFIFFGVVKILQTRSVGGAVVGGALILVGAMMTMRELGLFYIGWNTLWPLMLILVGLSVVFRSASRRRVFDAAPSAARPSTRDAAGDSVINVTAVMGGFTRRVTTPDFRGGEVTVVMGGCELDLRDCSINGEAELNVFAVFGGIEIRVPPDWCVIMHGTPIMGGFEEKTATPPNNDKRLRITGSVIMGGLEVRN
jgi:predicted membrane protein